ncbi:MAG: DUF169 domain-containing protein, partial [SAR324 cluster bacterium]|nr:DUF169 domain-containing protein [SAR324 cluster bacterium]
MAEGLNRYLRLRSIPVGMKRFKTREEMEAVPGIRRPPGKLATDQVVAQARQLGWTVGITMDDPVGARWWGCGPGTRSSGRRDADGPAALLPAPDGAGSG